VVVDIKQHKNSNFTITQSAKFFWHCPTWTDFHQILHIRRYAGCNHLYKFWFGKIKGFRIYVGSNFGFSHWNGWSPLQQCCATAQPVM